MNIHNCLVFVVILLCIAIINNFIMYYNCYINNINDDPFVPDNVGKYTLSIYYNKNETTEYGVYELIKPQLDTIRTKIFGKYVATWEKPTQQEYQQIAKLGQK